MRRPDGYIEHLLGMEAAMALDVDQQVAASFADIAEVESVYILHRPNDVLRVYAIVNEEDDAVYDQIYDREHDLEKRWAFMRLDFNVIARRNRPVVEFLGSNTPAWERTTASGDRTRTF